MKKSNPSGNLHAHDQIDVFSKDVRPDVILRRSYGKLIL